MKSSQGLLTVTQNKFVINTSRKEMNVNKILNIHPQHSRIPLTGLDYQEFF